MRPTLSAIAAAILIVLLPLILAAPKLVAADLTGWLHEAGRATALVGTMCLLLAGMLSVRIPGLDPYLGGLTRVWRLHHMLGAAAFLLLMAHPLLLALAAATVSPHAALSVLWPPSDETAVWLGWGALVAMVIFLAPSFWFFGRPDYQRWKYLHLLSAVAIVAGLAHTLALTRAIPGGYGTAFWITAGTLTGLLVLYRLVLSRWIGPYRYAVEAVTPIARGVVELSLVPEGEPMRYRAGQFAYLRHFDSRIRPGYNEEHPYTISSSPEESRLRFGIKALGDASAAVCELSAGARVTLEGPYGDFFPAHLDDRPQLWIGGGIGITPFVSRARDLAARPRPRDYNLVYCANRPERAYYHDDLTAVAKAVSGFVYTVHYFNEQGVLSLEFLRTACPNADERWIFICGPEPMTHHVLGLLHTLGVPRHRIHTEEFDLL